jgi:hypothetical protein
MENITSHPVENPAKSGGILQKSLITDVTQKSIKFPQTFNDVPASLSENASSAHPTIWAKKLPMK